jgi:HupE/UreJ protein
VVMHKTVEAKSGNRWEAKLALIFALLSGTPLFAHPSPYSAVMLDFERNGVAAELTLPLGELELGFKQPLQTNPAKAFAKEGPALKDYIRVHVNPQTEDGRNWDVKVRDLELQTNQQPFDLIAHVWMLPPPGASTRKFIFNYSVINHEVMSHWAMVSVRNDWDTAIFSSHPEPLGSLHFLVKSLKIDRTSGSWWKGFHSVFMLGIHHIAEGTDHLLFLLVLLLPAPLVANGKHWGNFGGLKRGLIQLLKIVSAFTFGHSLTLLIGAIGLVRLPEPPIEVLIAVSIFVSAIHAIRPWFAGREIFIAAGFGLIHGLAFASSLAEFNFSAWSMASTVLGFNLGIEAMQLAVVAMIIPWLILSSRTPVYAAVRILGATFGALASFGWIVERTFGLNLRVDLVVNVVAHHWLWLVGGLAVLALSANVGQAFYKKTRSSLSVHPAEEKGLQISNSQ